jgi:hypothetical protein
MQKLEKLEIWTLALLIVWFLFNSTNVNPNLGLIYSGFAIASICYILIDPKREIYLKKNTDNILGSLLIAAVAYIVLIAVGVYLIMPGTEALVRLLAATTPPLSDSIIINKINFGIAIAIVETLFFFVYGFDLLASLVNVEIKRKNLLTPKLWILIFALAFVFAFFHISAKGLSSSSIGVLTLVWFMAVISMFLVAYFESGLQATIFHVLANSLAIGLIPFNIINFNFISLLSFIPI